MTGNSARKLSQQNKGKDADLAQSDSNGGGKWSDAESILKRKPTWFANGLDVKDSTKGFGLFN